MGASFSLRAAALIIMFVAVSSQTCVNQWSTVPSNGFLGIPTMTIPMPTTECNILSGDITIQSVCTVKASSNVTVQWYYSPNKAEAGINGTTLPFSNNLRITVDSICHLQGLTQCSSTLIISDVKEEDLGYYWCRVAVGPSSLLVSHLSPVLNLTGCNALNDCVKFSHYRTNNNRDSGCAVEEMSSEDNDNITIVNFYDTCPPESSPESSPSTSKPVDLTPTLAETSTVGSTEAPKFMETSMPPISSTINSIATTVTVPVSSDLTSNSTITTKADQSTTITAGSGDGNVGLPLSIIWPIVGGGVGLLLFVVIILLALILIVQCRRKRGKGEITPNNIVNQGYGVTMELENSTAPMVPRYQRSHQPQGYPDTTQLYDEIPSNFTITASSSEHSPHTGSGAGGGASPNRPTSSNGPPSHDLYDDIDDIVTKPSPGGTRRLKQTQRKHQYESVSGANDKGTDYNQQERSESAVLNQKLSTSRLSGSPALISSESGSGLFDNSNYSHCKPSVATNTHIDIYGLGSSESNSGSGSQTRQQWIASSALESHSESSGEDVSKFHIVSLSESKARRQISNSAMPPPSSDQYTHVLPETRENRESNYTHRIVSSDEKYVSERGHVYQMLEKEESSSKQQQELDNRSGGDSMMEDRFVSSKGHIYHILENPGACGNELAEDQQGDVGDQRNIYHILEEPTTAGDGEVLEDNRTVNAQALQSEADDAYSEPEYDVIESEGQPPIHNRSIQSDYNVVERPEMRRTSSAIQQPEQHYDVTDRTTEHQPLVRGRSTTGIQNRRNPYNVIERNTSANQLSRNTSQNLERTPPLDYSVLAMDNTERKDKKFKIEALNPFYDVLDLDSVEGASGESHHTGSGPPIYNSLDTSTEQTLSSGIDNAIYHAAS